MHWIPVITVAAIAQVAVSTPGRSVRIPVPPPADDQLNLDVFTKHVKGARPLVDVEIRNASERAVDAPVTATVWLTPIAAIDGRVVSGQTLYAAFDPTRARGGEGQPLETPSTLRLPIGGSRTLRLDIHKLTWTSTAPLNVWTPRALWLVAEPNQRDFTMYVQVKAASRTVGFVSKDLRLRIEPE